jgi:predicted secreted protein
MKIRNFLFTFVFLLVLPAAILAGDYAELNYIGVSSNGKYLAFEEYGMQDGSGFTYSNIYFIDVAANKYAASPVRVMIEADSATIEGARAKANKSAAAGLKKFGIVRGNTGKLVAASLLTDAGRRFEPLGDDKGKTQTIGFYPMLGSLYTGGKTELMLKPVPVKGKVDYLELPVYQFELTLRDSEKEKVLQKDTNLPDSRGLPIGYAMEYVYLYKDKIIVFVNVFTSGFEGPDMRYLAVTGNRP